MRRRDLPAASAVVLVALVADRRTARAAPPAGGTTPAAPASGGTAASTGFAAPVTALPTGSHSHWLQPWRTMLATRPLGWFENGIGIQNSDLDHPDSLAMFRRAGIRHLRIGLDWSFVSFHDPGRIPRDGRTASLVRFIGAAKRAGLRPLVLLQAFSQGPCPHETRTIALAGEARPGDRSLRLADTTGLVPGRSGLTAWWQPGGSVTVADFVVPGQTMCAVLFTAIGADGTVRLSRPLPVAIPDGSRLVVDTLAVPPFGPPGTPAFDAAAAAWRAYVGAAGRFMTETLGTAEAPDRGFDLECWNELTFGSEFLDIDNYYDPPVAPRPEEHGEPAAIPALLRETARAVAEGGDAFRGVRVTDGFAGITPLPAASLMPPRIGAMSKHPYPTPQSYPAADAGRGGLDRFGRPTDFVPRYTMFAHEWFSTAISPFTLARDIAPTPNDFGGLMHGADARLVNGAVSPVPVWMTETGTPANAVGVSDPTARMRLLAKGTLRAVFFNLGIGVERVYLFRGVGPLDFFSLVPDDAPTRPTLPLQALERILAFLRGPGGGTDGAVAAPVAGRRFTHALTLRTARPPAVLFAGNGSAGCPDMVRGDDFVVVPIAVSPTRTAFVCWFIGLDMRHRMTPVPVTLRLAGLGGAIAGVASLDPLAGATEAPAHRAEPDGTLAVDTVFDDVPRVLVVTETA